MQTTKEILGILHQWLSSWPIVILILAIIFNKQIRNYIDRLQKAKGPWGELDTPLQEESPPAALPEPSSSSSSSSSLSSDSTSVEERPEELAKYWKFQYLSNFLVPNSQKVLNYFRNLPDGITRKDFETFWTVMIPDPNERQTILNVLLIYNLISEEEGKLKITEEGSELSKFFERKEQIRIQALMKALHGKNRIRLSELIRRCKL